MSSTAPTMTGAGRQVGRYTLHAEIASGGMATVHFGQMLGAHGFSRVVAIKRMLPRLARDPAFQAMFTDEARMASRVHHPNVVPILDVVDEDGEVIIVMEYVRGPSLSTLLGACLKKGDRIPIGVAVAIACGMLAGLHAAHEALDRQGKSLGIVHRDVSPQNVLVGVDGVARLMDFGVAKATNRLAKTQDNQLKGKLCYMAPEQVRGSALDRRADIFAAAVVLWSSLAGRRLFRGGDVTETIAEVIACNVPPLTDFREDVPHELESVLRTALAADRDARPATAEAFAAALEAATPIASTRVVSEWVLSLAGSTVADRERAILEIEQTRSFAAPTAEVETPTPQDPSSHALTLERRPPEPPMERDTATRAERGVAALPLSSSSPSIQSTTPRRPSLWLGAAVATALGGGALFIATRAADGGRAEATSSRPTATAALALDARGMETTLVTPLPPSPTSATSLPANDATSSAVSQHLPNAPMASKTRARPKASGEALKPSAASPTGGRGAYYPPAPFPK